MPIVHKHDSWRNAKFWQILQTTCSNFWDPHTRIVPITDMIPWKVALAAVYTTKWQHRSPAVSPHWPSKRPPERSVGDFRRRNVWIIDRRSCWPIITKINVKNAWTEQRETPWRRQPGAAALRCTKARTVLSYRPAIRWSREFLTELFRWNESINGVWATRYMYPRKPRLSTFQANIKQPSTLPQYHSPTS